MSWEYLSHEIVPYIFFLLCSYTDFDRSHLPPNEKYREVSNLVEHPIVVQPPGEPTKPIAFPVMLTSKERKKLRRQRRREAEKEKQEKIQFGLIEKPEPKVCKCGHNSIWLTCSTHDVP